MENHPVLESLNSRVVVMSIRIGFPLKSLGLGEAGRTISDPVVACTGLIVLRLEGGQRPGLPDTVVKVSEDLIQASVLSCSPHWYLSQVAKIF